MSDDAVGAMVNSCGRGPEGADLVIDAAAESGAAVAPNDEEEEFVLGGERFVLVHPLEGADEIVVKAIALLENFVDVKAATSGGVCHGVIAVLLGPEEDKVVGGFAVLETEFALRVAEVVAFGDAGDVVGNEEFLAGGVCGGCGSGVGLGVC